MSISFDSLAQTNFKSIVYFRCDGVSVIDILTIIMLEPKVIKTILVKSRCLESNQTKIKNENCRPGFIESVHESSLARLYTVG